MSRFQSMLSEQASHEAQRWMPPDVGIPPPPQNEPEPEPEPVVPRPTAEEVEAIKEAARTIGAEAGYQAGYEAGYETGQREAREQVAQEAEAERQVREEREASWRTAQETTLRETVAALEGIAQALADPLAATVDALEPELLSLTATLARRVIMEELSLRPELIQGVLRQALTQLPSRHHPVRVHVHPDEQATLAAYAEASSENLIWVADSGIERGGCLIDSGPSRIDASLDTRLRQSIDAIWGELAPPAEPVPAARQETTPEETSADDAPAATEALPETVLDALTDVMPEILQADLLDTVSEADEPLPDELESAPEPDQATA